MVTCEDRDAAAQQGGKKKTPIGRRPSRQTRRRYLVDPEEHRLLQVKGQLLGAQGGEALDGGHHLLHADHLQHVGRHQGVDEVNVSALEKQGLCV